MNNKLLEIVENTKKEVALRKEATPSMKLETSISFIRMPKSLSASMRDTTKTGIIAEYKRKSPSKGMINDSLEVEEVVKGYEAAGASAVSILTDSKYFDGSNEYLTRGKAELSIPVLRKDFIVDEYQVIEAKAIGADAILLIAACLSPEELMSLAKLADNVGLEVLMEVHSKEELESHLNQFVDVVGVNNRNLKTFEVSTQLSLDLINSIPTDKVRISESGLGDIDEMKALAQAGYDGFLIGETFMRTDNPGQALKQLADQL